MLSREVLIKTKNESYPHWLKNNGQEKESKTTVPHLPFPIPFYLIIPFDLRIRKNERKNGTSHGDVYYFLRFAPPSGVHGVR